jgi:hypothetical protein
MLRRDQEKLCSGVVEEGRRIGRDVTSFEEGFERFGELRVFRRILLRYCWVVARSFRILDLCNTGKASATAYSGGGNELT